jgi:8-amino-7-oxononanoate synthase
MGYEFIDCNPLLSKNLREKIQLFRKQELQTISAVNSPIQAINIADNQQLLHLKNLLFESGLQTYAIFSPTVKVGEERLRICLHAFNKDEDIQLLSYLIKENLPLLNG